MKTPGAKNAMIAICKSVDIVYGCSDTPLPVAGETVADVRDAVESMLNIPRDAEAFMRGQAVDEDYVLKEGDRLEFLKRHGFKGGLEPEELEILAGIREAVNQLLEQFRKLREQPVTTQQWFTPKEVAAMLGNSDYTVREWCRETRIKARKRTSGRGAERAWEISTEEIDRYRNHGLLPRPRKH